MYQKPITKLKEKYCKVIIAMMRNGGTLSSSAINDIFGHEKGSINRMMRLGLIVRVAKGLYSLNWDVVNQCSYVVPDALYEKLSDKDYVRKIYGMSKGMTEQEAEKFAKRLEGQHQRMIQRRKKNTQIRQASREARKDEFNEEVHKEGLLLRDALFGDLEGKK
jgi:hypothetical protein